MSKPTTADRLVQMCESERFTADRLRDVCAELVDVREWAEALNNLAEAVDELEGSIDSWADAEDRETKADARDEVLACLQAASDAYLDIVALPPMNLGLEVTP